MQSRRYEGAHCIPWQSLSVVSQWATGDAVWATYGPNEQDWIMENSVIEDSYVKLSNIAAAVVGYVNEC